ncbi:hypothetical protein HK104_010278 [Borealophlyctis nickersoniae]|nr:hypothetical protein HK104_010278 [Borealophlyctis nickersoniae]
MPSREGSEWLAGHIKGSCGDIVVDVPTKEGAQISNYIMSNNAIVGLAWALAFIITCSVHFYNYLDPVLVNLFLRRLLDQAHHRDVRLSKGRLHRALWIWGPAWILIGEHPGKWLLAQERANLLSGEEGRPKSFSRIFGKSLINQDGAEHARTRRLLSPAFKLDNLKAYLPRMVRTARAQMDHWAGRVDSSYVDLQHELKQLTLRLAFNLLIGADFPESDHELTSKLVLRYRNFFASIFPWPIGAWNGAARTEEVRRLLSKDVEEIIRRRMKTLEGGAEPDEIDPLWLLMKARDENGNSLSVEELANEALLLVVAGHETTAVVLGAFAVECIRNPHIFAQARAEQDDLFKNSPDRLPTNEDIKHMPYLDAIFRETERLYAPALAISRRASRDLIYTPPDGGKQIVIKKGSGIVWDVISTNRDPEVYDCPDEFIPDRWLHSNDSPGEQSESADLGPVKVSNFKLATFGAGHRICLGMQFARMEMLAIGALLLREYDFTEVKPGTRFVRDMLPIIHWRDGVPVKFRRRSRAI